jgi:hypothetical protein
VLALLLPQLAVAAEPGVDSGHQPKDRAVKVVSRPKWAIFVCNILMRLICSGIASYMLLFITYVLMPFKYRHSLSGKYRQNIDTKC